MGDKSPVHTWRCRTAISAICCAESEPLCVVANGSQLQVKSADAGSDGGWSIVNNKYYDETVRGVLNLIVPQSWSSLYDVIDHSKFNTNCIFSY